ncbi:GIY-YIG nuclease family protein [Commensalibacter communis]|uniref:GIY-YIG nuclease family protein n=1 Tax=Commensalibacter communis TaxID=2972786 RepID=UPI0022FF6213|nr:GIY-YIG nuclease family protein [Commensalibacter communis]CAI3950527.1 unnamed protein product [Commensalibacter communis]CAI3955983.1 unnamed protein product [Commensalibacter communis]
MLDICYLMSAYDPEFFKHNYKIKYVRHKDSRGKDKTILQDYLKEGVIKEYQKRQRKPVFSGLDYIIVFAGLEETKALFWSVFKVGKVTPQSDCFYYELEEINTFQDLKFRAVIDWGKATVRWYQEVKETNKKPVIEIYPSGYVDNFPGYDDVLLSFVELERLIQNQDSNKDWYYPLSTISAVYLIYDSSTGKQYVGSASGESGGLWGRWSNYIQTKHGGNKKLIENYQQNKTQHLNYVFSILLVLPKGMSKEAVIKYENLYKKKLGSRAYGLNQN